MYVYQLFFDGKMGCAKVNKLAQSSFDQMDLLCLENSLFPSTRNGEVQFLFLIGRIPIQTVQLVALNKYLKMKGKNMQTTRWPTGTIIS